MTSAFPPEAKADGAEAERIKTLNRRYFIHELFCIGAAGLLLSIVMFWGFMALDSNIRLMTHGLISGQFNIKSENFAYVA
jgi:hypothetical protein